MSGFLQRLAGSAARPTSRVRPLIESIYSIPLTDGPASAMDAKASPSVSVEIPEGRRSRSIENLGDSTLPPTRSDETKVQGSRFSAERESHAFEPLMWLRDPEANRPYMSPRPFTPTEKNFEGNLAGEISTSDSSIRRERRTEPQRDGQPSPISLDEVMSRLFAEKDRIREDKEIGSETKETKRVRPQASSNVHISQTQLPMEKRGHDRKAQPPHPATPAVEEIEIHIGRIEVLAVPQPAPRQAPALARKGMSLDDYLSRRNGRVG